MDVANSYIINSYRYLRLGLVVVTLTLGISLVLEIVAAGCLQGSISAFYYTPVHAVFIGVLFVIGVALVALRGRDTVEDMFFNLAGFLAPVVALVPTSRPDDLCGPAGRHLGVPNTLLITNNSISLFLGFGVAFLAALVIALRQKTERSARDRVTAGIAGIPRSAKLGLGASAAVLVAGVVWYQAWNDSFQHRAHATAAALMFVAIWFAVLVNADFGWLHAKLVWFYGKLGATVPVHPPESRHSTFYRPAYRWLAAIMFVLGVVLGIGVGAGVSHAVFWLEVAEIVPFAVFWALQTGEGWDSGRTAR